VFFEGQSQLGNRLSQCVVCSFGVTCGRTHHMKNARNNEEHMNNLLITAVHRSNVVVLTDRLLVLEPAFAECEATGLPAALSHCASR
jgi:hypothetical protein